MTRLEAEWLIEGLRRNYQHSVRLSDHDVKDFLDAAMSWYTFAVPIDEEYMAKTRAKRLPQPPRDE